MAKDVYKPNCGIPANPYLGNDMTSQVITVTSGKGGVGKTTAVANLATALAADGRKVVCIDGDIGLRNLDVVMGLENRIVYDIVDVIEGRCKLKQAMIRDKHYPEMYLIPAAQTRDKNAVSPSDMIRICKDLRPDADFILIDSPAGIERGFRNAIAAADKVLVVTNPEVSAVRDADRVVGILEAEEKRNPLLILNRLNPILVKNNDMLSAEDVLDLLGIQLIGIVPEDESVIIGSNRGAPVVTEPKSRAGQAFRNIAKRLQGQEVPFMDLDQQSGLWGTIQKLTGRK
jgi:septum site-determining protein MinD